MRTLWFHLHITQASIYKLRMVSRFNPFETRLQKSIACSRRTYINALIISSRLSSNSEACASELLENLEEMFLRYYMNSSLNFQSHTDVSLVAKGLILQYTRIPWFYVDNINNNINIRVIKKRGRRNHIFAFCFSFRAPLIRPSKVTTPARTPSGRHKRAVTNARLSSGKKERTVVIRR